MPRYFFHRTDGGFEPDIEGTQLPNLDAARAEAVRFAAGVVQDHPDYVWEGRDFRIEVTDEGGMLLCTVVVLGIVAPAMRGSTSKDSAQDLTRTVARSG